MSVLEKVQLGKIFPRMNLQDELVYFGLIVLMFTVLMKAIVVRWRLIGAALSPLYIFQMMDLQLIWDCYFLVANSNQIKWIK